MATLDENITFLQEAKEAQDALTKLKAAAEEQELSARKLEKSLASEQKAVADSIELTVKKRRSELEKGFNDEISKTASQLKAVQDKRGKAKDAEVKARIATETADTKDHSKQLKAQVRQLFKASGVGVIAGCYVTDGIIERGSRARVMRGDKQIFDGDIASLKRFKDEVKGVKVGFECGIVLDDFNDVAVDDNLEIYKMVQVPRQAPAGN